MSGKERRLTKRQELTAWLKNLGLSAQVERQEDGSLMWNLRDGDGNPLPEHEGLLTRELEALLEEMELRKWKG